MKTTSGQSPRVTTCTSPRSARTAPPTAPPTLVWPLVVGGEVYVRAANGQQSRWYAAALSQKAGRIRVGGKDYEVTFEPAGNETASAIDAAYEEKYKGSSAVPIMQGERPKSATVRISPR
jgi:hypothetical protein